MGPNDSGKSNTIGALLFVFGYRASSKLRQGKLSELIHYPVRYLNLHECSGEVLFRAIIDLLRFSCRCEIAEHEANLEKEEKILKGIRDSLKGGCFRAVASCVKRKRKAGQQC